MMDLRGRKVIVVGTGKSGIGSAVLLEQNGALPVLYDGNEHTDKEAVKAKLAEKLGRASRAEIYTGPFQEALVADVPLAVLSPGVPVDAEFVVLMKAHNIHIWGEIELGYQFAKGSVIAITGTNGKTTTTSLVG